MIIFPNKTIKRGITMTRTEELKKFLHPDLNRCVALAFSVGADSTLLLSILKELRDESPYPLAALTMQTAFQRDEEIAEARSTAEECGVNLEIFHCDPLSIPEIRHNPPERCYWCKRYIFRKFLDFMQKHGLAVLLDGTNADDLHVYRPGRKALQELGVISPLAELGFTKTEIRALAAARGMRCASRPSLPCPAGPVLRVSHARQTPPQLTHGRLQARRSRL